MRVPPRSLASLDINFSKNNYGKRYGDKSAKNMKHEAKSHQPRKDTEYNNCHAGGI
jgi:hypothetical protein